MQHFYKSMIVLLIAFEFQIFPLTVITAEYVSVGQNLYQTGGNKITLQKEYCTLGTDQSHIDPPILLQSPPIQLTQPLTTRTCEVFYPTTACCNINQTAAMKQSTYMNHLEYSLQSCPACLYNIWALWCGYTCSPYQASIVNVTLTRNDNGAPVVQQSIYFVDMMFAQDLYLSCAEVPLTDQKAKVKQLYKTSQQFVDWIMGLDTNSAITVFYVNHTSNENSTKSMQSSKLEDDNVFAFYTEAAPCNNSCGCFSCNQSCEALESEVAKNPPPEIEIFNVSWSHNEVILASVFCSLLFVLFVYTTVQYSRRPYIRVGRFARLIVLFITLFIFFLCIGVVIIGTGLKETDEEHCVIMMFNSEWGCLFVGISTVLFVLIFLFPLFMTIYYYYRLHATSTRLVISQDTKPVNWLERSLDVIPRKRGILQNILAKQGRLCADYPIMVSCCSVFVASLLCIGMLNLHVTEQDGNMWMITATPGSASLDFINHNFGPTPRVEKMIITAKQKGNMVLEQNILNEVFQIQQEIYNFNITAVDASVGLKYLCYKPTGVGCKIDSVLELWQSNNITLNSYSSSYNTTFNPYQQHVMYCSQHPTEQICLSTIGTPVTIQKVLGGFNNNDYWNATALMIQYFISNEPYDLVYSKKWEDKFLEIVQREYDTVNVYGVAEKSFAEVFSSSSSTGILTVVLTYLVMFGYTCMALGKIFPIRNRFVVVDSKFLLGLAAILMVLLSLLAGLGVCSMVGLESTVLINLVIPFLVLSFGIDNLFILVDAFDQSDPSAPIPKRMSDTLSQIGGAVIMCTMCEVLVIFSSLYIDVPAVHTFALFSGVALIINFFLQFTCFVSLICLEARRVETNRVDCAPCIQLQDWNAFNSNSQLNGSQGRTPMLRLSVARKTNRGAIRIFTLKKWGPFLLRTPVKLFLLVGFFAMFFVSIDYSLGLEVGLAKRDFLSSDSYMTSYMDVEDTYSKLGPALTVVIKDTSFDFSNPSSQDTICYSPGCHQDSLLTQFKIASFMSGIIDSWLDDYIAWANSHSCCQFNSVTHSACMTASTGHKTSLHFSFYLQQSAPVGSEVSNGSCVECCSVDEKNRPLATQFLQYLPWFTNASAQINCSVVGKKYEDDLVFNPNGSVKHSRFTTYTAPLNSRDSGVDVVKNTLDIINDSGLEAIAYSEFFTIAAHLMDIETTTFILLTMALSGEFFIVLFFMGNPSVAICILVIITMTQVDVMAAMKLFGLYLNGLSLLNLMLSTAISTELCVYIGHSFTRSSGTKNQRAYRAVVETTSPLVLGIAVPKAIGVFVLYFTVYNALIQIYYVKMLAIAIAVALVHALLLLPVLLSFAGTEIGAFCLPQKYQHSIGIGEASTAILFV